MPAEVGSFVTNRKSRKGARGVSKVKTGCKTCKIRHKKCDEVSPECSQCTSTGRQCDFLFAGQTNFGARSGNDELQRSLISNIPNLAQTASLGSLGAFVSREYETLCTQAYQKFADREFAATFEIVLWQRVMVQMARIEQYVRSALVAIGALVRHKLCRTNPYEYEYALMQYNSAIVSLNQRLDNSAHRQELGIIGAFLFTAFEIIQGREDRAQMHIQSAFTLLRSFSQSANHDRCLNSPSPKHSLQAGALEHTNGPSTSDILALFSALSRLAPQMVASGEMYGLISFQVPDVPTRFTSLVHAREYLLLITNTMRAIFSRATLENRSLPYAPLPASLAMNLSIVQDALDTWLRSFGILTKHIEIMDIHKKGIIQVLLLHHCVAKIQASTHFFRDESTFDSHDPQFEQIVSLAQAAREADEVRASAIEAGPCYMLDIGMAQPMFYVARKCRNGSIRRAAIEVMEHIRGNRVQDIQLLVQVAKWIVSVEEELDLYNGLVPEHKRLHDIGLDFYATKGSCRVTAWQRAADGNREDVTAVVRPASRRKRVDLLVPS